MKRTKIFKCKRGVALENAVLFMLLIFLLCTLLASMSLFGHRQANIEKKNLLRDVEIEQIGEDYLASLSQGTEFSLTDETYVCEIGENTLTVRRKTDQKVVLYVEAEAGEDRTPKIRRWQYSLPTEKTT